MEKKDQDANSSHSQERTSKKKGVWKDIRVKAQALAATARQFLDGTFKETRDSNSQGREISSMCSH